jgi:hypothetical protein
MKRLLFPVLALTLAVAATPELGVAEHPAAGHKRELRAVVVDLAEINRRLADASAEVEIGKLQVARWYLLSTKCGGCYRDEIASAKEELRLAEMALDKLQADLRRFPLEPRGPVTKQAVPGEVTESPPALRREVPK